MTIHNLIDRTENFDRLSQKEQIKRIAYFYCIVQNTLDFNTKNIKDVFIEQKLSVPTGITSLVPKLAYDKPISFLKTKNGYTLHRNLKKEFDLVYNTNEHAVVTSQKLRDLLSKVKSTEQIEFLEEAIKCFELKAYRASIIMSWLLAMDVLYEYVLLPPNLTAFNSAIQLHGKYKKIAIKKKDDFSDLKETDFIELLRASKLVSNDIRKILDEKLGVRNSSAHPNTIKFEELKTMAFIKDLVINLIERHQ